MPGLLTIFNTATFIMVPNHDSPRRGDCWAAMLALVLAGCAGQVPPGGGPKDTTSPVVIRTVPDTSAVHVTAQAVVLEFSEYVDHSSVEQSIFISPNLGDVEYDWDGREVTVRFREQLRKNTTYVVSVGTDVRDYRAGNNMAAGYTLAFSTGDSIDRGYVGGRVFDEKPAGVMVFAYRLDGLSPDTLDPSHTKPDYVTQSGKSGSFALSHLSFGRYRLVAVRDEYHNLFYDRQVDDYGVSTGDILLSENAPRMEKVWFRLAKEDTTRPFLAGVRLLDRFRITVRFSEAIDSASFTRARFSVSDTLKGSAVPLLVFYQDREQPFLAGLVTSTPLDSPATYRVRVGNISDIAGNMIDSTSPGEIFAGILAPDTLRPRISVRDMRDSIRGVATYAKPEILFSDPVVTGSLQHAMRLFDSTKTPVDASMVWTGPSSVVISPRVSLASLAWYTLRVSMDSVRSLFGRGYRDSTYLFRFQTMDLRTMGYLSGTVVDEAGTGGKGRVFVSASRIDAGATRPSTLILDRPGTFTFAQLVEGKYVISGFRDADSLGGYSFGLPAPFTPSERFVVYPDTVRVRARWGVEGVELRFR